MKEKLKELAGALLGYSVVAIVILAVIAVIAVVGGSIMSFFGFEYESLGSIILFFIIVMIVGFPLEILSSALPAVFAELGRCTEKQAVVLYVLMDTLFTAVSMAAADYFMDSVSASDLSILVNSIILFFIIVMIVGFPLEILSSALPAVFAELGRCTEKQAVVLYVLMDTLFTAVSMAAADYFMDSVSASDLSILVISFLFSLTSIKDFREKLGKDR